MDQPIEEINLPILEPMKYSTNSEILPKLILTYKVKKIIRS